MPLLTPHVIGAVPVAANVNEYAVPTKPLGGAPLVITGGVPELHDVAPGGEVCPPGQAVCVVAPAFATKKFALAGMHDD